MEEKETTFVEWLNALSLSDAVTQITLIVFVIFIIILVVRTFRNTHDV